MIQFSFEEEYVLEGGPALLRPLQPADFKLFLPFSLNEPDIWHYSLMPADGRENLKHYLTYALRQRSRHKAYTFTVFDRRSNACAGCTRYYDMDFKHKTLLIGFTWYGKAFQGTGLNKYCKYLLLDFAFEQLQMERVEFHADSNNARSLAAMKSIGCTVEGVLRSNKGLPDGRRRDSTVLSILRPEWYSHVKDMLHSKLPS